MGKHLRLCTALPLVLILAGIGIPAFADSSTEIVQSIPIETTLEVPGIRQTQQVWVEMISAAKRTLDLEEFYIYGQSGEALDPVLNAVRAAAARGVQVHFLIDSQFYKTYPNDANNLNQVDNIEVRTIDFSSQGGVQHSKYFVVDQSDVFLGSANFDWLALSHIHEVGLHLSNPQVASGLEEVFSQDWSSGAAIGAKAVSSIEKPFSWNALISGTGDFRLVASPPSNSPKDIPDSQSAITNLIGAAKNSLRIQVYQYTTKLYKSSKRWKILDAAIRSAASRGVHVQLLVDAVAMKTGSTDLKSLATLNNIEVRTVIIPEWSGGPIPYARLIHSKYFTVDGSSAWVGTENWSGDYFTNSRNVGLTFQTPEIVVQLNQIFDRVWNSSYATPL